MVVVSGGIVEVVVVEDEVDDVVVASTTVVPVVEGVSDGLATVSGVAQAAARARSATPIATLMHEEYDEPGVLEAERENHPLTHA